MHDLIILSLPIVLVGNKTDLHMERMISNEEGRRLAESWKAAFLETSAKQNEVTVFLCLCYKVQIFLNKFLLLCFYFYFEMLKQKQLQCPIMLDSLFCVYFLFFKSVGEIFHTLLLEIEKANGNVQEKSSCVIS